MPLRLVKFALSRKHPQASDVHLPRAVVTLWVDPSFAHYFWTSLLEVGRDLEGFVVVHGKRQKE